jgi:phosphoribosylformylglycinamidine synthase
VSDGGLAVALAEMAMASGIGADVRAAFGPPRLREPDARQPVDPSHPAFWFGEDQARYVVTVHEADAAAVLNLAGSAGVPVRRIGTTGGNALTLPAQRPNLIARLSERFENWLPAYMSGGDRDAAATPKAEKD